MGAPLGWQGRTWQPGSVPLLKSETGQLGALGQPQPQASSTSLGMAVGREGQVLVWGGSGPVKAVGALRAQRDSALNLKHILIPNRRAPCLLPETPFPREKTHTFLAAFMGWLSAAVCIPGKKLDDLTRNAWLYAAPDVSTGRLGWR